jgi:hypothetical protein
MQQYLCMLYQELMCKLRTQPHKLAEARDLRKLFSLNRLKASVSCVLKARNVRYIPQMRRDQFLLSEYSFRSIPHTVIRTV